MGPGETDTPSGPCGKEVERGTKEMMRILGVCGGIGSGKSLASSILVDDLGCVAGIDADKLGHEAYAPGSDCVREIAEEFGGDVVMEDGEVNRKVLGSIVFGDAEAMSVRGSEPDLQADLLVVSIFWLEWIC